MAALAALVGARGSTVVVQGAPSGVGSGALVLGGVGVSAALLLRLRGFCVSDVLYVSRATFKHGVATLGSGLQSVSTALARVRTVLSERIDALSGRVEEGLAAQAALAADAAATRAGVDAMGEQLTLVSGSLEEVEAKLAGISAKQDFSCRGIYLLCSVVSQTLKDGGAAGAAAGAQAYGALPAKGAPAQGGAASLLELLNGHAAGQPAAAVHVPPLAPMTGTVREQLAAISSLAASNLNLAAAYA